MSARIRLPGRMLSKVNVDLSDDGKLARTYGGNLYGSLAEATYAASLDLRVKVGDLIGWARQIRYPLIVNGQRICWFVVDFRLQHQDKSMELVEIKGWEREAYKLKIKLFRALYPNDKLTVIPAKTVR